MPRGAGRGRASKLTPEVQTIIVEHLKRGGYLSTAAQLANVGESTVHRWIAEGGAENAPRPLRDFRDAVHAAEAHLEEVVLSKALAKLEGTEPDVRLGLEVLARRQPDKWAPPKVRAEVTGADGGGIDVNVTVSARKSLLDALDGMGKRMRGEDTVEDD